MIPVIVVDVSVLGSSSRKRVKEREEDSVCNLGKAEVKSKLKQCPSFCVEVFCQWNRDREGLTHSRPPICMEMSGVLYA
jgi:hypothetical protein